MENEGEGSSLSYTGQEGGETGTNRCSGKIAKLFK